MKKALLLAVLLFALVLALFSSCGRAEDSSGSSERALQGVASGNVVPTTSKQKTELLFEYSGAPGLRGFANAKGEWVIEPQFSQVSESYLTESMIISVVAYGSEGLKTGFIDSNGDWVVEPKFESAYYSFSDGFANVSDSYTGKMGYIDVNGDWAIEPQFGGAMKFENGLAPAQDWESGLWGLIGKDGKWTVPPAFRELARFSDGLAYAVSTDGGGGYIDTNGNWVIEPKFNRGSNFAEGYATVTYMDPANGRVVGAIDKAGEFSFTFNDVLADISDLSVLDGFAEGLIAVRDPERGAWGYMDALGRWMIDPVFSEAREFSQGLAIATDSESGKIGYIDTSGSWVIEPQFIYAFSFSEVGYAQVVCEDNVIRYINIQGKPLPVPEGAELPRG